MPEPPEAPAMTSSAQESYAAPVLETYPAAAQGSTEHFSLNEEPPAAIPEFNMDQPLPTSALDGYVLDEHEVLDAIVQVDTQNVEQEAQVLEAVEVLRAPAPIPASEDPVSQSAAAPSPASAPAAPGKSGVKHGFY